jgi:hypothetical protein
LQWLYNFLSSIKPHHVNSLLIILMIIWLRKNVGLHSSPILLSFLSNQCVCVCVCLSLSLFPLSLPTPPILWCSMSGCWASIMMHVRVVPIVEVKYEKKFMHYFIKLSTY